MSPLIENHFAENVLPYIPLYKIEFYELLFFLF